MKTSILTVVFVVLSFGSALAVDLSIDDDFPVVGEGQRVSVSGAERVEDLDLWVVFSPNSETQRSVGSQPMEPSPGSPRGSASQPCPRVMPLAMWSPPRTSPSSLPRLRRRACSS